MSLPQKLYTLVFVRCAGRILLGMKKRGFGEGRWNGFGGKVEPGETSRAAAARELQEESGVTAPADRLQHVGRLVFTFEGEPVAMRVAVYTALRSDCRGELRESDEMRPRWFDERELPFESMWPDDAHWFPHMLSGRAFLGEFAFRGHDTILSQTLTATEAPLPDDVE